ncbi:MAG: ATP synthase F1 subunit delta [Muribaculaceae bacterium]|nr:ATP synthase F1 subunit delta [Muribaculaceae bacterium]MDE6262489.1 ATP synthase F1 subunit delta [Muribaculaceae bacterium]MDE6428312.1 ATP synthase F1 subunit delta [Muribaculaceae bacterium]
MDQGLIPRRYAKALLMLASEHQSAPAVYEAMIRLADSFAAEPQLRHTLSNPAISNDEKLSLVLAAAGAQGVAAEELSGYVKLLCQNRRLDSLYQSALAFIALYRAQNHIFKVNVTSAAPLSAEEMGRIKSLVERQLPADSTADFSEAVNPDLIGGFTVSIDNELLDASVANELKQLRIKLLSH